MSKIPSIDDEIQFFENVQQFFKAIKNRQIRYWVYKRKYTPYEESSKFEDESIFEDHHASEGYVKEVVLLPDNDVLLGIASVFDGLEHDEYNYTVDYYKLSEIRLSYLFSIEEEECDVYVK